ncbi:MAG: response regulator transcription factor [Flavobacteriaceae bacterium]|nr:response regulator transcription factor [Flavobacteriaceae bacterium]
MKHTVTIVDDHSLFAKSLTVLVNSFTDFRVVYHAKNGKQFLDWIAHQKNTPDIVLLDVNMPVLNGLETMSLLYEQFPNLKVLILSMDDDDETIIRMLRRGARGYLLKDIDPEILQSALLAVASNGFYNAENKNYNFRETELIPKIIFKKREIEFLKWVCTEKTYKEIAQEMFLSPKTIDGYRENLFEKLNVRSRVGLVLYAIKNKIINI